MSEGLKRGAIVRGRLPTIVFPVKHRKALLSKKGVGVIVETAKRISERDDIEIDAIGCDKDHIHHLCSTHPNIAPGRLSVFSRVLWRERYFVGKRK